MARRPKRYKITSKPMLKDAAAARRAFNRPHDVDSIDQPKWTVACPYGRKTFTRWKELENERAAKRQRDLILYAVAMAQKTGRLPLDCRAYSAEVISANAVEFYLPDTMEFPAGKLKSVTVMLRFLDWVPDEPVEELLPLDAA